MMNYFTANNRAGEFSVQTLSRKGRKSIYADRGKAILERIKHRAHLTIGTNPETIIFTLKTASHSEAAECANNGARYE